MADSDATSTLEAPAAPAPAAPAPAADEKEQKPTSYVVFSSDKENGPWERVGEYDAHGQPGAKKAAAAALGQEKAEALWFIAMPKSSYNPQKPKVNVTTTVTF